MRTRALPPAVRAARVGEPGSSRLPGEPLDGERFDEATFAALSEGFGRTA